MQRVGAWSFLLALACSLGLAGSASAQLNPVTLSTGHGVALQRSLVTFAADSNRPSANLRFDFSFGTDEFLIPGEFVDSLTITLRTTNRSHSVILLTADRFGVTWMPDATLATPVVSLDPGRDLVFGPAVPAAGMNGFDFVASHRVAVQLPEPFLRHPSQLVVSFFDNDDPQGSRAVVSGIVVRSGNPSLIVVESSAAVAGPYGRESVYQIDPLQQTITVPKAGGRRFYQADGDTPSRVTSIQRSGPDLLFEYTKDLGQPTLRLLGANQANGPFAPVLNAVHDFVARRFSVPLLNAPAFFRVDGTHPARVTNDVVSGNQRLVSYEVVPRPPELASSTEAAGPYAQEWGVIADPFARRLRLPLGGMLRFYRVSADVPLMVRDTVVMGDNIVLHYDEP